MLSSVGCLEAWTPTASGSRNESARRSHTARPQRPRRQARLSRWAVHLRPLDVWRWLDDIEALRNATWLRLGPAGSTGCRSGRTGHLVRYDPLEAHDPAP